MEIELLSSDNIKIYIYEKIDCNADIRNVVKEYIVYTYYRKIGLFLNLIKIDDSLYKDSIDLKIILNDDNEVYFKTINYLCIKDLGTIRYLDGEFYGLVDDSFDKLLEKVEFGKFIFGYDTNLLLRDSIVYK